MVTGRLGEIKRVRMSMDIFGKKMGGLGCLKMKGDGNGYDSFILPFLPSRSNNPIFLSVKPSLHSSFTVQFSPICHCATIKLVQASLINCHASVQTILSARLLL